MDGTLVTIAQFFLSAALAIVLALAAGLMKLSDNAVVRRSAGAYIEVFRGTSLLVQLY